MGDESQEFGMQECEVLEEFPPELSNLRPSEKLHLLQRQSLRNILEGFGGLRSLWKLDKQECEALEEFAPGSNNLPNSLYRTILSVVDGLISLVLFKRNKEREKMVLITTTTTLPNLLAQLWYKM